jgi:hypothetical protein
LCLVVVIFVCAEGLIAFAANTPGVYKNADIGFSIRFPNTWEIKEGVGGIDVIAPPCKRSPLTSSVPTVAVIPELLPKNESIEEYA